MVPRISLVSVLAVSVMAHNIREQQNANIAVWRGMGGMNDDSQDLEELMNLFR